MPSRIIREGFVDSEAVSSLSDWAHRVYSNLLLKVDDAGRYDARLEILRSHLFPLGTTRRAQEINQAMLEFESTALATRYQFAGKDYVQLTRWQRTGSAKRSKFPWKDGSLDITYLTMDTKDGPREFVFSSIPSVGGREGVTTPPNNEIRITKYESQRGSAEGEGKLPPPRFQKPRFDEMELHAAKIGLPTTEINRFFDYYEANGWRVGKNPMKDWRAAMQNWKRNYDSRRYENQNDGRNVGGRTGENPRNAGIVKGPTDYAAAFKRKAEATGKTQVAGASDRTDSGSPATEGLGGQSL